MRKVFVTKVSGLVEILSIDLLKIMVGLKVSVVQSPKNPNNQIKNKAIKSEFRLANYYTFLQKTEWMSQILIVIRYLPLQETMSKDPSSAYKGHVHIFPEMETTWIKSWRQNSYFMEHIIVFGCLPDAEWHDKWGVTQQVNFKIKQNCSISGSVILDYVSTKQIHRNGMIKYSMHLKCQGLWQFS